jgi:DNA-binding transcriptional LysR family regulator
MIELTKLEIFIHAAETLSFSEAARQMHLSQPTVSHHIKRLEHELAVELFDRSGHNLHLTEAGRFLLPWARKLMQQSNEMQELISSIQQKIVGQLRIACSTTAGKYILPQLAARFKQKHPGIQVSILSCTPEHVVPRLLEREANLGVVSYEALNPGFESQEFFQDSIHLIVPREHPWAFRQTIDPAHLIPEPMIMREPSSGTRRVLAEELAKHDIAFDALNVFLELGNAEAIVETVAAGFGVSFVSRLVAACALEQGKVVEVPVRGLDLRRTIYMVRRSIDAPHRPQEAFWAFVHVPTNADLLRLPAEHS